MITRLGALAAALLVLGLAPSAFAECSWVLWSKRPETSAYYVHSVYMTKADCRRAATAQDNQSKGERATNWCLPVGGEPGASGLPEPWTRVGRRRSDLPELGRPVLGYVHDAPGMEIATSLASQGAGTPVIIAA
jgi:hypothetical protein